MNVLELCAKLLIEYKTHPLDSTQLEIPQNRKMWDCSLPCFHFAKQWRETPQQIAEQLAYDMSPLLEHSEIWYRIEAVWWYLNFYLKTSYLATMLFHILEETKQSHARFPPTGETILVESPWPNTNKPLHLWHVRNMLLGNALKNTLKAVGHTVHSVDIVNDRWIHISKSMLAYQLYWNNQLPDCKPDHFVWKRYVKYAQEEKNNPALAQQAQALLQAREEGDDETVALRKLMRERALSWQKETYKKYGISIDKTYYESDHYMLGKVIIQQGINHGIFTRNDNNHIIYIDPKLGEKIVLRSDGTAVYMTQDIALWKVRYEDRSMDRMIYVVWNEQEDHFKCLFNIFKALQLPFAPQCHHLSYGMVWLPDWKMKSREWTVIDADDILEETTATSFEMLKERYPTTPHTKLQKKAVTIALGAIKFFFLKYDANKNFVYDKTSSLRFDWETWPYIQYTYARCCSILKKSDCAHIDFNTVDKTAYSCDEERQLLAALVWFPSTLEHAARTYQPYLIARFLLDIAATYNSFYHAVPVLAEEDEQRRFARLWLVEATRKILKTWLDILGIDVLEEM